MNQKQRDKAIEHIQAIRNVLDQVQIRIDNDIPIDYKDIQATAFDQTNINAHLNKVLLLMIKKE